MVAPSIDHPRIGGLLRLRSGVNVSAGRAAACVNHERQCLKNEAAGKMLVMDHGFHAILDCRYFGGQAGNIGPLSLFFLYFIMFQINVHCF